MTQDDAFARRYFHVRPRVIVRGSGGRVTLAEASQRRILTAGGPPMVRLQMTRDEARCPGAVATGKFRSGEMIKRINRGTVEGGDGGLHRF